MAHLKVPIIATIIGEGGSGGALAIAVADHLLMLQYAIYSVISPEGCASILWKSAEKAPEAAEALGITAHRLKALGLIDRIVAEPLGGAHRDPKQMAELLKRALADSAAPVPGAEAEGTAAPHDTPACSAMESSRKRLPKPDPVEQRLLDALRDAVAECLPDAGQDAPAKRPAAGPLLIGLSGGRDSTALLDAAWRLRHNRTAGFAQLFAVACAPRAAARGRRLGRSPARGPAPGSRCRCR